MSLVGLDLSFRLPGWWKAAAVFGRLRLLPSALSSQPGMGAAFLPDSPQPAPGDLVRALHWCLHTWTWCLLLGPRILSPASASVSLTSIACQRCRHRAWESPAAPEGASTSGGPHGTEEPGGLLRVHGVPLLLGSLASPAAPHPLVVRPRPLPQRSTGRGGSRAGAGEPTASPGSK